MPRPSWLAWQKTARDTERDYLSVKLDDRTTHKPGWKFAEYELKGVPVRIAMGPRDLEEDTVEIVRRDTKEKATMAFDQAAKHAADLMVDIQENLLSRAKDFREANTTSVDTYDDFKSILDEKGGFVLAHWDGTNETEEKIKNETKATIRCVPFEDKKEEGNQFENEKEKKKNKEKSK